MYLIFFICNKHNANLLVSIHLNANEDITLDYTQGLYGTDMENKDQKFTQVMHDSLLSMLQISDNNITDFSDNILMKANMPATLQETVFITNTDEYQSLTDGSEKRQYQIAQALYNGIVKWFSKK